MHHPYRASPPRSPRFPKAHEFVSPASFARVIAYSIAVALLLMFALACSGAQRPYTPPENTLVGIHLAAHGVALTDGLVAPHCGVSSPAPACATFVTAYGVSRASMLVLEQGARQWRQASDLPTQCRATVLMRNAYADVITLQAAMDSLHVPYPHDLVVGAQLIAGLIATNAPACLDGGTP